MNDILPDVAARWQYLESEVESLIEAYGYHQVRLPLLEHTEVFRRSIGEVTEDCADRGAGWTCDAGACVAP